MLGTRDRVYQEALSKGYAKHYAEDLAHAAFMAEYHGEKWDCPVHSTPRREFKETDPDKIKEVWHAAFRLGVLRGLGEDALDLAQEAALAYSRMGYVFLNRAPIAYWKKFKRDWNKVINPNVELNET